MTKEMDIKDILTSNSLAVDRLLEAKQAYFTKEDQRKSIAAVVKDFDKVIGSELQSENQILTRKAALFWLIGDTDNSLYILNSVSESREKKLIKALDEYDMCNHATAFTLLNELYQEDRQNPDLLYLTCVSAIRCKIDKADELIKKINSIDEAKKMYAQALYEQFFGSRGKALELYESLLQKDPTNREALFQVACLYDLYGMDEEAIELYEQLRLLRPLNIGVMFNLGVNYEDRGEAQKAIECYQAILDYYPNNKKSLLYLKDAIASLKMYYDEEAIRQRERQKQLASQSIVDMNLSTRTKNTLNKASIYTLADLLSKTEEDLLEVDSMGQAMLKEIKDLLHAKNLHLYSLKELKPEEYVSSLPLSLQAKPLSEIDLSPKAKEFIEGRELTTISDLLKMTEKQMKDEGVNSSIVQELSDKLKLQFNIRLLPG
ncbi:MAG: tetratricopeptide repeat protein [Planctomycetes bacterium]|nr:tetratricopeptide repeat protein [Planctomycetota bacterium]